MRAIITFVAIVSALVILAGVRAVITDTSAPTPSRSMSPSRLVEIRAKNDPNAGVRAAGHDFAKSVIPDHLSNADGAEFPWDAVTFEVIEDGKAWIVRGVVVTRDGQSESWQVDVRLEGQDSLVLTEARLGESVVWTR